MWKQESHSLVPGWVYSPKAVPFMKDIDTFPFSFLHDAMNSMSEALAVGSFLLKAEFIQTFAALWRRGAKNWNLKFENWVLSLYLTEARNLATSGGRFQAANFAST